MTAIKPDFSSREALDDRIWWAMCDVEMSFPVSLNEADLTKPFVYDRRYGVFYVNIGMHVFAMALLLAWDQGVHKYMRIDYKPLGISDFMGGDACAYSDYFLENTKGTCYLPSLSKTIKAGAKCNLNDMELDYFYPVDYLDN